MHFCLMLTFSIENERTHLIMRHHYFKFGKIEDVLEAARLLEAVIKIY